MNRMIPRAALAAALTLGVTAGGAHAVETNAARLANLRHVEAWSAANQREAAGNPGLFVCRGLRADRASRTVELLGESCGLRGGYTAEFGLVGEQSDRDYEAMARAFARPGDVARALEFIGLPRGRGVSTRAQRFWPRGERVRVAVQVVTNPAAPARPLESLVLDRRRDAPLPAAGFVFCGSLWSTGSVSRCLADEEQPMSILSTYNEPQTVLDVPRRAAQGDVYESFVMQPREAWAPDVLLRFTLTPEPRPDGTPRVLPVAVTGRVDAAQGLVFDCATPGAATERLAGLAELVKSLGRAVAAGRDPYVELAFDDAVPLARARETAQALLMVEGESGIRMDAPPPGQAYYRAFLPEESWRSRTKRLSQPLELRITPREGGHAATLVQTLEDWSDANKLEPKLTVKEFPLASLAELPAKVRELGESLQVLLVYAPPTAPLSAFMPGVRLVRATHPIVYFFEEP